MSSMLAALRKRPDTDAPPTRWITVLDEDPSIEAPKFELEIEYRHPHAMELLIRPFRKQIGNLDTVFAQWPYTNLRQEDREKFLMSFFKAVKDWRGFGRKNAGRLFPNAVENGEELAKLPDEIPFSAENRDDFAIMLDREHFPLIYRAVTETEEWGVELQARKNPGSDGRD